MQPIRRGNTRCAAANDDDFRFAFTHAKGDPV
jgi:hypothetical protein